MKEEIFSKIEFYIIRILAVILLLILAIKLIKAELSTVIPWFS
ncbi:MAG: hypothetical protein AB7U82_01170 [Blastocatellales bacterium]